jgi:hypothetical protein
MKYFFMIWPPGITSEFKTVNESVLTRSGGGFRVRNGIFRARFAKRAPAEHTAVADTAGAIFALIA